MMSASLAKLISSVTYTKRNCFIQEAATDSQSAGWAIMEMGELDLSFCSGD